MDGRCIYFDGDRLSGQTVALFTSPPHDVDKTTINRGVTDICKKKIFPFAHHPRVLTTVGPIAWLGYFSNSGRFNDVGRFVFDSELGVDSPKAWEALQAVPWSTSYDQSNPDCPLFYYGTDAQVWPGTYEATAGLWQVKFNILISAIPPEILNDPSLDFYCEFTLPNLPNTVGKLKLYIESESRDMDGSEAMVQVHPSDTGGGYFTILLQIGPGQIDFSDFASMCSSIEPYYLLLSVALAGESLPKITARGRGGKSHACWPADVFDESAGAAVIDTSSGLVIGPFIPIKS
jgi:hypothetical protein